MSSSPSGQYGRRVNGFMFCVIAVSQHVVSGICILPCVRLYQMTVGGSSWRTAGRASGSRGAWSLDHWWWWGNNRVWWWGNNRVCVNGDDGGYLRFVSSFWFTGFQSLRLFFMRLPAVFAYPLISVPISECSDRHWEMRRELFSLGVLHLEGRLMQILRTVSLSLLMRCRS